MILKRHIELSETRELRLKNLLNENMNLLKRVKSETILLFEKKYNNDSSQSLFNIAINMNNVEDVVTLIKSMLDTLCDNERKLDMKQKEFEIKQKEIHSMFDNYEKVKRKIKEECLNNLNLKNQTVSDCLDMFFYIQKKKRRNRSHREICEKHKNCKNCKYDQNKKHFFSFQITNTLYWWAQEKGFEEVLLFDEKECCEEMSTQILKCISELCQEYKSKSSIWYRNFFREKFIIKKNFTSIHEKFYNTFLHPKISGMDHNFEDFMKDNKKMCHYYKYYLQFDHESGSKLTLKNQIGELKKTKKKI